MSIVSIPASFVINFFKTYRADFVTNTGALGDAWESQEVVDSTLSIFSDRVEYYYSGDISAMDRDELIGDIKNAIIHENMTLYVPTFPPISNCICVQQLRRTGAVRVARASSRAMAHARASGSREFSYFDEYERACDRVCSSAIKNACGPICKKDCIRIYTRMTCRANEILKELRRVR